MNMVKNTSPVEISRDLLKSVKASRQRYQTYLEDQRKESKKKEKSDEIDSSRERAANYQF